MARNTSSLKSQYIMVFENLCNAWYCSFGKRRLSREGQSRSRSVCRLTILSV